MNNVNIIRLIDGSSIISEVVKTSKKKVVLNNPLTIVHDDVIRAYSFIVGMQYDTAVEIQSRNIIASIEADEFLSKFYGSSLIRFCQQLEIRKTDNGVLDKDAIAYLKKKEKEISSKFGSFEDGDGEEQQEDSFYDEDTKKVIH